MKMLAKELEIMSGLYYLKKDEIFEVVAAYAQDSPEEPYRFSLGEGLNGQVARNQEVMVLSRLPENYREVYSGLGRAQPSYLALVPLIYQKQCVALIECTGYRYQPDQIESMFRIMTRELAKILETGPEQPGP